MGRTKQVKEINQAIRHLAKAIEEWHPSIGEGSDTHQAAREIQDLTHVLEGILMTYGIKDSQGDYTITKSNNKPEIRQALLKELTVNLELSANEIILLAEKNNIYSKKLGHLDASELHMIYNEAKALHFEGCLSQYLDHLASMASERALQEESIPTP